MKQTKWKVYLTQTVVIANIPQWQTVGDAKKKNSNKMQIQIYEKNLKITWIIDTFC